MSKVYLVPVSVFLIFQVTFIGTYIAAILQGHVVPAVPYISDAATYSPESCVFGQLINIGSVLLGITIYVRYRVVLEVTTNNSNLGEAVIRHNKLSLWFGLISCLGISIVANFQETNVRLVHYLGAICCFGFGTLYFLMQALISYVLQPIFGTKEKAHFRLAIALACIILFIESSITGLISHILFNGQDPRKWYPSDGGWHYHVASSISEWVISTLFCFYILTFTNEFRDVHLEHPQVSIVISYENVDTQ